MKPFTFFLIGYGNPGRLDDGLGPAVAQEIEKMDLDNVTVDANYQLSVEDADVIARNDVTLFVDADTACAGPFWFGEVTPRRELGFSSHSISPGALMDISNNMLGGNARGYILGIRGYEFDEFGERLSEGAKKNLEQAVGFIEKVLDERDFDRYIREYGNVSN